jgi:hypothetical protein
MLFLLAAYICPVQCIHIFTSHPPVQQENKKTDITFYLSFLQQQVSGSWVSDSWVSDLQKYYSSRLTSVPPKATRDNSCCNAAEVLFMLHYGQLHGAHVLFG